MSRRLPFVACTACDWSPGPPSIDPYPFRCPNAGTDDGDHLVSVVTAPVGPAVEAGAAQAASDNPFVRYRTCLYSWQTARSLGLSDGAYVSIVERVDAAIARIAGTGFEVTPFGRSDCLGDRLGFGHAGGVWVKDETRNVSGSHKARHLMGVALYLEVLRHARLCDNRDRPLAVASCGNAALAAAVVAAAIGRRLLVFVPDHAAAAVVSRLQQLGATVTRCTRASDQTGDPSYLAFRRAVAEGALPFSCQGNENGLAIEGAMTLGYEIVDRMVKPDPAASSTSEISETRTSRVTPVAELDRVFIQVGGGALASACVQAFERCLQGGRLAAVPRIHAVQTCGGHPLTRAYDRLVDHIFARLAESARRVRCTFTSADERARYLVGHAPASLLEEAFAYARLHRSQFMWPWESEPHSIAGGILDDETYDWAAVVEAMVKTGGYPIVVDEGTLEESNHLARETTGIDVDHTGSSGLAGLLALTRSLGRPGANERIAVLFTGVRR